MPNQRDLTAALLASIRSNWGDELTDVSLAMFWPHLERAAVALHDPDARRRSDAVDQVIDALQRAVEDVRQRHAACDAFEDEY